MTTAISIFITAILTEPTANLPTLTSVYTPADVCLSRWWANVISSSTTIQSISASDSFYYSCQPLQAKPTYSPGVCPSGQTIATLTEYRVAGATFTGAVWKGACCNSGFALSKGYCYSTLTSASTVLVGTTIHSRWLVEGAFGWTHSPIATSLDCVPGTTRCASTVVTSGKLMAEPVTVSWQNKDLSVFPESYASSVASLVGVSFTASSGPPVVVATISDDPQDTNSNLNSSSSPSLEINSGLNKPTLAPGVIAGIVIGAVAGAILFGLGVLLLLRRRRKRNNANIAQHNDPPRYSYVSQPQQQDYTPSQRDLGIGTWSVRESQVSAGPLEMIGSPVKEISRPLAELEGRSSRGYQVQKRGTSDARE